VPLHLVLQRAPAIARLSRDGRWRRGELKYYTVLIPRKLLIVLEAVNALIAVNAYRCYNRATILTILGIRDDLPRQDATVFEAWTMPGSCVYGLPGRVKNVTFVRGCGSDG
jgi:hypothetical protein